MNQHRLLLPLAGACLLAIGAIPRSPRITLTPLDKENAVLTSVHVLALAVGSNGTIYAGGRDTYDPRTPNHPNASSLGSVFLVSHDQGAQWTKRVDDEPPPGYVAHFPPWTDHTRWPSNFTVSQVVVDPRHPSTIYAVGGFPYSSGDRGTPHFLLRSTDNGHTWTDVLVHSVNLNHKPALVTNIVVTPANRESLTYRSMYYASSLVIDPGNSRHLYLGTDELGVLRSLDGGTSWQYNPTSPDIAPAVSEKMVLSPDAPHALYVLVQDTTSATLYRTGDDGATWRKVWHGIFASNLIAEGHTLYVAARDGVYTSTDQGQHWRLAATARTLPGFTVKNPSSPDGTTGMVVQALHDTRSGTWIVVAVNDWVANVDGLYATTNGGATWSRLTTGQRGLQGPLALAITDMEYGYTRLWIDDAARPRVVFTSGDVDGLYRWGMTP